MKPVKKVQEPPKNQSNLFGINSSSQSISALFGQAKPKQTNSYASYDSYGGCPHFRNGGTCRNCLWWKNNLIIEHIKYWEIESCLSITIFKLLNWKFNIKATV